MFCEKCGTEITAGDVFCPTCGTRIEDMLKEETEELKQQIVFEHTEYADNATASTKRYQVNVKSLGIIGAIIAVLIAGILIVLMFANTVSAEKFISEEIEAIGYNGYATVSTVGLYDYEGLATEICDSIKTDNELLGGLANLGTSIVVENYVQIELDKSNHLSNGDVVTVTFTVNKDAINEIIGAKKKVRGKSIYVKEYKINGLSDPVTIDVFESIKSVSYDSTANYNPLTIEYNTEFNKSAGEVRFSYYANSNLIKATNKEDNLLGSIQFEHNTDKIESEGKITLTVDVDTDKYISRGVIFTPLSKEFDAVTIDYLRKADDINNNDFGVLKAASIKYYKDHFQLSGNYLGAYYIEDFARNNYSNAKNRIYFIFKFAESEKVKRFVGVRFTDVKIDSNGDIIDVEKEPDSYYMFYEVNNFSDVGKSLKNDSYNVTDISSKG